jgi:hypothetical protein
MVNLITHNRNILGFLLCTHSVQHGHTRTHSAHALGGGAGTHRQQADEKIEKNNDGWVVGVVDCLFGCLVGSTFRAEISPHNYNRRVVL